jgi:hypothetical protein
MSLRICAKGHLTGQRHCGMCGADADAGRPEPGDGRVLVKRHQIPRDANGRNELRELRAATRVGKMKQAMRGSNVPLSGV